MRALTTAIALAGLLGMTAAARATAVTGDINFDGSNTYSTATHSVSFIGGQNAQSDTGDFAAFGTCTRLHHHEGFDL